MPVYQTAESKDSTQLRLNLRRFSWAHWVRKMSEEVRLPKNLAEWRDKVREARLENESIHTANLRDSASKISLQQFLLLRVLWDSEKKGFELNNVSHREQWIDQEHLNSARRFLSSLDAWGRYLDAVQSKRRSCVGLGTFAAAWESQLEAAGLAEYDANTARLVGASPKVDFTPSRAARPSPTASSTSVGHPSAVSTPSPLPHLQFLSTLVKSQGHNKGPSIPDFGFQLDITSLSGKATPDARAGGLNGLTAGLQSLSLSDMAMSPMSPFKGGSLRERIMHDEEIVNVALVVFLRSLTVECDDLRPHCMWSPGRYAFRVCDRDGNKVYEARVVCPIIFPCSYSQAARFVADIVD